MLPELPQKENEKSINVSVPEEVPRKNTTNCAKHVKLGMKI